MATGNERRRWRWRQRAAAAVAAVRVGGGRRKAVGGMDGPGLGPLIPPIGSGHQTHADQWPS